MALSLKRLQRTMKSTLEWRLVFGLLLVVLALLGAGGVSYHSTQEFAEAGRSVAQSQEVLRELESTLSGIKDVQHGELAFLLSGRREFLEASFTTAPVIGEHLGRLMKLSDGTPRRNQILDLQRQVDHLLDEIRRTSEGGERTNSVSLDLARILQQAASRTETIQSRVAALVVEETKVLKQRSEVLRSKARLASGSFLTMTVLTFGLVGYVFCRLVHDMRDRRRSMELLRHSEERYRVLAENSLDLISLVDPKNTLVYASPSHQRVLGWEPSRLMGQNLILLIHSEDMAEVRRVISELPRTGPARPIDVRLRKADGNWLESELLLSTFSIGAVTGHRILLSARDVSDRKQAQREREKLIEELQVALARIKVLSGFIPICSSCKKIRDDQGYWNQLEAYIQNHSEAQFSHGICPDCAEVFYPDYFTKRA
jgi:PAS domain S-box-containing protein